VAALPDKQRTAVALRFIADSAYAEIASAMATSEPAARRSVHEGLKRLRDDLEERNARDD
jgi:DNA-directed RNA polymerase specialized sigma24 family protein